jgi:5'-AMP-activated protein kinase catalytic alpha subunit
MNFNIKQVIGTKTKIYIVMEYVSGGQLLDKMVRINNLLLKSYVLTISIIMASILIILFMQSYAKLDECEARKLFQQLIDSVDYCHNKGVYHRDLKVS